MTTAPPPSDHKPDTHPDPPDLLPVVADEPDLRPYLEIRPSERAVDFRKLADSLGTLCAQLVSGSTRLLDRYLVRPTGPPVEFIVASDGGTDPVVRYFVRSLDPGYDDAVRSALRHGIPRTWEFRETEWHPHAYLQEALAGRSAEEVSEAAVGIEYYGAHTNPLDWQTSFRHGSPPSRETSDAFAPPSQRPLATLIETMGTTRCPIIYQVVFQPLSDWSHQAERHLDLLENATLTMMERIAAFVFPIDYDRLEAIEPNRDDAIRAEGLKLRDPAQTFGATVRAIVVADDDPAEADAVASLLQPALGRMDGPDHRVLGRRTAGRRVLEAISDAVPHRLLRGPIRTLLSKLRRIPSDWIVIGANELTNCLIVDPDDLTPDGGRAVAPRPAEQTGYPAPPADQLRRSGETGQALGQPIDTDRQPLDLMVFIDRLLQTLHSVIIAPTGSGKTVLMILALLANRTSTHGPEIFLNSKGGDSDDELLRSIWAADGTFEDVHYLDLEHTLPATTFFDIRPLLAAGLSLEEARSRKIGHFEEILRFLMGDEEYRAATESVKIIRNHARALFDPVHGSEVYTISDLLEALDRTQIDRSPPPVSDEKLERYFTSLLERDRDVFQLGMGGAVNRVDTIATDDRLAPLFDYVGEEDGPAFDFADLVNEDIVLVVDFGGMEDWVKQSLTVVLLSNLWVALHARERSGQESLPLVNLYFEEGADIASTRLVDTLLAQGRSFGVSLMLGVQHLWQLRAADRSASTYYEVLRETATFIVGPNRVEPDIAEVLATATMSPADVARRLAAMARGEWLVRLAAPFGKLPLRPFLMRSLPAPKGHPASDEPLEGEELAAYEAAVDQLVETTQDRYGIDRAETSAVNQSGDATDERDESPEHVRSERLDTAYPYSKRMPSTVIYNEEFHGLQCLLCGNRYNTDIDGMVRAIECHASLDEVDRDDIPIGPLYLKLTLEERLTSDLSDAQHMFVQVVYNIQQGRYDPLEYDIVRDSMLRVVEYVGISPEEIQDLIDRGLLTHDTDRPHRLYSVTPDGRATIGEAYRQGVDFGHGKGDLEETSEHVLGVTVAERYLEQHYLADPASPVERIEAYYDVGRALVDAPAEQRRLDLAALDGAGNVVVAVEVERINHDWREAIPQDYDKMAACDPAEALWVTMNRKDAHRVLEALNEPGEGESRISKTYRESTAPQDFSIDAAGLTAVATVEFLRDQLDLDAD